MRTVWRTQQWPRLLLNDYVFLLGRPPVAEFLHFIASMAVDGQNVDQGQLTQEWRQANDHVAELETSEAGISDNLQTRPCHLSFRPGAASY